MKNLTMIAAIGKNNELGKSNDLIWHIKKDLSFFKENTINKPIIMGINTFHSLPKKLPKRKHIILTHQNIKLDEDILIFSKIKDLLEYIRQNEEEFMVIGGASIYNQLIDYSNKLLLTEIEDEKDADVYFPYFNKNDFEKEVLSRNIENGIEYSHNLYVRKRNFKD